MVGLCLCLSVLVSSPFLASGRPTERRVSQLDYHYVGNIHLHSHWSDGERPLDEIVDILKGLGRRFAIFTDHDLGIGKGKKTVDLLVKLDGPSGYQNYVKMVEKLSSKDIIAIPGMELTCPWLNDEGEPEQGHLLLADISLLVEKFDLDRYPPQMVNGSMGLMGLVGDRGFGYQWEFTDLANSWKIPTVAAHESLNQGVARYRFNWKSRTPRLMGFWNNGLFDSVRGNVSRLRELLKAGEEIGVTADCDYHSPITGGEPRNSSVEEVVKYIEKHQDGQWARATGLWSVPELTKEEILLALFECRSDARSWFDLKVERLLPQPGNLPVSRKKVEVSISGLGKNYRGMASLIDPEKGALLRQPALGDRLDLQWSNNLKSEETKRLILYLTDRYITVLPLQGRPEADSARTIRRELGSMDFTVDGRGLMFNPKVVLKSKFSFDFDLKRPGVIDLKARFGRLDPSDESRVVWREVGLEPFRPPDSPYAVWKKSPGYLYRSTRLVESDWSKADRQGWLAFEYWWRPDLFAGEDEAILVERKILEFKRESHDQTALN